MATVIVPNMLTLHGGQPSVNLPQHILHIAAAHKGAGTPLPPALVHASLVLGAKPCKARAPHAIAWAQQAAAMVPCTAAAMVAAGVPAHNVAYQVANGWLAVA